VAPPDVLQQLERLLAERAEHRDRERAEADGAAQLVGRDAGRAEVLPRRADGLELAVGGARLAVRVEVLEPGRAGGVEGLDVDEREV